MGEGLYPRMREGGSERRVRGTEIEEPGRGKEVTGSDQLPAPSSSGSSVRVVSQY